MAVTTNPSDITSLDASIDTYRPVRVWLWCVAALVFLMVFVGGATRLTDSGLSITEWRPITGAIPPLSAEGWEAELEKYRQIPEYQRINRGMSMAEFQFIYWWEWGHRFLGRLVGLAFVVPLIWFAARKALPPQSMPKLLGLLALGGLQGFVGWWMVASGLTERVDVSQYRLAVHLTMAAIILASIAWVAQSMKPIELHLADRRGQAAPGAAMAALLGLFVLVQIFLGALVAGLDAGLTYTTWPLMDGDFIPPAAKLFIQSPWYVNFGENVLTVQWVHRMGAYALLGFAIFHAWRMRRVATDRKDAKMASALVIALLLQALIGIVTLLTQIEMEWALLHQFWAFVILVVTVLHRARLVGHGHLPTSQPA
ncbi:MAG: COX15/CtaA family protein [Rhizobiales bacterium]|nr:COX15/CtaA family protein [Hyphomicrobiales bacterium]MBO6698269.1 COX15/CtaA family protein [Hyphomicrobiales bacterium]MBO6735477.1 COX15/CtaA family protein [Hyphomicrobiales bacterium]MBO6910715.1 COX15/CtaA family protein [Hyphomicrobiales bacterium]MBO6956924.1 COX15/CtaA family protein [Hyphomicrobiales bacterium]